jgi:hypothetical protein
MPAANTNIVLLEVLDSLTHKGVRILASPIAVVEHSVEGPLNRVLTPSERAQAQHPALNRLVLLLQLITSPLKARENSRIRQG